jgi:hypothetical protein
MSVWAISTVRDEADIIVETLTNMVAQVDVVVVADNGSVDGTRDLLAGFEGPEFIVFDDTDPAHYQSRKMSALAALAAERGATWVVPFDGDEIWRPASGGRIADVLSECSGGRAPADLYNHVATALDPPTSPVARMEWRTAQPLGLPKVACRPRLAVTIHEGNHGASYPDGVEDGLLEVRHFPYRSAEQFLSKVRNGAAALAATTLSTDVGAHWRQYGELLENAGPEAVEGWFREHFFTTDPAGVPDLVLDPCPSA